MSNRIHSFAIILHPRRGAGTGFPAHPRKGRRRTSLPAAKRKGREEKDHLFRSESAAPSAGEGAFARSRLRGLSRLVAPRVPTAPAAPLFIAPGKNAGQPLYLWVYRNRQIWTVRERNVNDRGQDGGVFAAGARRDAKISKVAPTAFSRGIPQRVLFKQPLPPVFPAGHPPHPQKIAPPAREGALRKSSLIPRPSRPRARSRARRRCRSRSSPWPRSLRWRR